MGSGNYSYYTDKKIEADSGGKNEVSPIFFHHLSPPENQRTQWDIGDPHSQPPPRSRDLETSREELGLGLQSQDSSLRPLQSDVNAFGWGCVGKELGDEGRPRLGAKELSRQLEIPELSPKREPYGNLTGQAARPCLHVR